MMTKMVKPENKFINFQKKNQIPLISKGDNLTESLLLHLLSTMNEKYKEI